MQTDSTPGLYSSMYSGLKAHHSFRLQEIARLCLCTVPRSSLWGRLCRNLWECHTSPCQKCMRLALPFLPGLLHAVRHSSLGVDLEHNANHVYLKASPTVLNGSESQKVSLGLQQETLSCSIAGVSKLSTLGFLDV